MTVFEGAGEPAHQPLVPLLTEHAQLDECFGRSPAAKRFGEEVFRLAAFLVVGKQLQPGGADHLVGAAFKDVAAEFVQQGDTSFEIQRDHHARYNFQISLQFFLFHSQLAGGPGIIGDVAADAENALDFAVPVIPRYFGRQHPSFLAVLVRNVLQPVQDAPLLLEDDVIVLLKMLGQFRRIHIKVCFADRLFAAIQTHVLAVGEIGQNLSTIEVFDVDRVRDVVNHRIEQVVVFRSNMFGRKPQCVIVKQHANPIGINGDQMALYWLVMRRRIKLGIEPSFRSQGV